MRKMISKLREKKGFTLAELLIVVAIIAVLVAIAIPIFNTQLEKSRDATDLANVRAAYAELSAALIGDSTTDLDTSVWTAVTGGYQSKLDGKGRTDGWANGIDGKVSGIAVTNKTQATAVEFTVSADGQITAITMK